MSIRFFVSLIILCAFETGAVAEFPAYDGTVERDAFWAFYNKKVVTGLQVQEKELPEQIAKATDAEARAGLEAELVKVKERLKKPEYFTFATIQDVPGDLKWEDGMSEPEIGDAQAKKGGTMRNYIMSFPPTLRVLGENSNSSFRGYHYDDMEMGLITLHPDTGRVIPAIAKEWAISADNRTVYYRIDPEARFSNGDPIEADDFFSQVSFDLVEIVNGFVEFAAGVAENIFHLWHLIPHEKSERSAVFAAGETKNVTGIAHDSGVFFNWVQITREAAARPRRLFLPMSFTMSCSIWWSWVSSSWLK